MKREIKFRFWDTEYKDWVELPALIGDYQADAYRTYDEPFPVSSFMNGEYQERLSDGTLIIQQYTGLKDANGVEIYEGDILKHDIGLGPIYYKVFWSDTDGAWMIDKDHGGNCGCWFDDYEIAGNIYENPELLDQ